MNEKHLEFIQSNISRMNQCSFQMKGWAITIVSAFLAIFAATITDVSSGNKMFIFIAIAPACLFWILDALYLSKERKFIGMYNDIVYKPKDLKIKIEFEMPINKYRGWKYSIFRAIISPSEAFLYGSLILGLILFGGLY